MCVVGHADQRRQVSGDSCLLPLCKLCRLNSVVTLDLKHLYSEIHLIGPTDELSSKYVPNIIC